MRPRYSGEYVNYLRFTLLPAYASDADVFRASQALAATPIVAVILAQQQPDGSWPLGGPPWFRVYPSPARRETRDGNHVHMRHRCGVLWRRGGTRNHGPRSTVYFRLLLKPFRGVAFRHLCELPFPRLPLPSCAYHGHNLVTTRGPQQVLRHSAAAGVTVLNRWP